jgi:hypothetical protein
LAFLPLPTWRGACPSAPSRCCVLLIAASLRPGPGSGEGEGLGEGLGLGEGEGEGEGQG